MIVQREQELWGSVAQEYLKELNPTADLELIS